MDEGKMRILHVSEAVEKDFCCAICGKTFKEIQSFQTHYEDNHGIVNSDATNELQNHSERQNENIIKCEI